MESMEQVSGQSIKSIHVAGGATQSPFWMQMKADILGKTVVCLDIPEVVTLGAAMLAGLGAGVYQNSADAVEQIKRNEIVYIPDMTHHREYRKIYDGVYKNLYPAIKEINHQIDRVQNKEGQVDEVFSSR